MAAAASLDDAIGKPPAGVVLPPKDIRAIVEKTAGYVARNGTAFEERIRSKEANNPKFSFLTPNDAYNAFFQWRLEEIRAGRGTAVSAGRADEPVKVPDKPKGPPQPPEFQFSAKMPNINALDLEVVKLTALFVAKNGRSWMTQLAQRETGNYQFDFLRPQHSLNQYFTKLIDQYTALLTGGSVEDGKPEKQRIAQLQRNVTDRWHVLERAKQRSEWVKYQEAQKQKKEEEAEAEKIAYMQIDWNQFVVVETVLFTDADEHTELPPPPSLSDLQTASLEQKAVMSNALRIEEAMPGDETTYYNATSAPPVQAPAPVMQLPAHPMPYLPQQMPQHVLQPVQQPVSYPQPQGHRSQREEEEEERIRQRQEERERALQAQAAAKGIGPMNIRTDYRPGAALRAKNLKAATSLCPYCKQQIPNNEFDSHIRIELLDPRWKEQKAKADERASRTNLALNDVAANLKRLASQRSDLFDPVTGQAAATEEAARAAKRQPPPTWGYDGSTEGAPKPAPAQNLSIEEQLKYIREKAKQ